MIDEIYGDWLSRCWFWMVLSGWFRLILIDFGWFLIDFWLMPDGFRLIGLDWFLIDFNDFLIEFFWYRDMFDLILNEFWSIWYGILVERNCFSSDSCDSIVINVWLNIERNFIECWSCLDDYWLIHVDWILIDFWLNNDWFLIELWLNSDWICLNLIEYDWTWLNYDWIMIELWLNFDWILMPLAPPF